MEIKVNDANFKQEVLKSNLPVLVDFWASWCGPCKMIAPAVEQIARQYQGKLKVCKLNVDEAPKIAAGFGIMSIPTLIIFKNGQVMEQVIGVVTKSALEEKISQFLENEQE